MSRKGVSPVCKSKQIPRIFQRRNQSVSGGAQTGWNLMDSVPSDSSNNVNENNQRTASSLHFLLESNDLENRQHDDSKKSGKRDNGICDNIEFSSRSWSCQGINTIGSVATTVHNDSLDKSSNAADTVADIEKWLKTRTESVSSIDLDTMKSVEEEEGVGVERYLGDDLPHAFLGKDPDGLSIDIDLSDKKLHLGGYDPILQELQSDKLLEVCEKNDDFILPEFQLDHLDPMTLSPEDMMVAGEILPSTSNHRSLHTMDEKEDPSSNEMTAGNDNSINLESQVPSHKAIPSDTYELTAELQDIGDETDFNHKDPTSMEVEFNEAEFVQLTEGSADTQTEACVVEQRKGKSKKQPRIVKRRTKQTSKGDENQITFTGEEPQTDGTDGTDGIMALVAISTDNISNMTQIVINTGKDEQIYQGKTSELIEATGNFPKLPKIDATGNWSNGADNGAESAPSTQHELIISNALEELGITDECLQPSSTNEHGKIWLCPRDDCNREFNKLYALKGHLLAHYGIRPFKCDYEGCTWAFHSDFKLKRHKETHLKRKDYVCRVPDCNRRFTTVYNLWSHEKLHTRPNRITCQVPDCQEKFQTKRALELHMKTHDQSHAPYVCQHEGCGKRYYSSNALTSHQRCHSYKEVDVKCSWAGCGKVFDKPCRLKAHIRSHTGSKPYLCTFQDCQWAFSSSSKLKRHEKKHTNERKFVCDVDGCGKAFMRSEHLKEHSLTHQEGRYFECYMCDACFSAKSSLYVHIKKHQIKEAVDTITSGTGKPSKRKTKESQAAIDKLVAQAVESEDASQIDEFYRDSQIQDSLLEAAVSDENLVTAQCYVQSPNGILNEVASGTERNNIMYTCGMETCGISYKSQSNLRTHMLTMHGIVIEDNDKSSITVSDATSTSNMDYIFYTAPSTMTKVASQMVMVEPGDTIILNTSPETVECLPEPEPPPLDAISRISQSSYHTSGENFLLDSRNKRTNQGSARTGLTREDVWDLKAKGGTNETASVGASDVVLGTADLTEGLLLTEELPSMYYQDDLVGTECQILLLDSGNSENTINLRDLD